MLTNKTYYDCWDSNPPPDMILTIPPPPMPSFFASSILPVGGNRSNAPCPLLCDWTTGVGMEMNEELSHRGLSEEQSWVLLTISSLTIVILFGLLTIVFLFKYRQNQRMKPTSHKTVFNDRMYESILYPSLKENHVLWATLNQNGKPQTVAITSLPPPLPPRALQINSFKNNTFTDLDNYCTSSRYNRSRISLPKQIENVNIQPLNFYPDLKKHDIPSLL